MSDRELSAALPLDHVGVSVSDLDRAATFYRDLFGFTRIEDRFSLPQHELRGLVLCNSAGLRIELFEKSGSRPIRACDPIAAAEGHGWFQIALRTTDIAATYLRLTAAGAAPVRGPFIAPDGKTQVAFIADPDGNLIELIERRE